MVIKLQETICKIIVFPTKILIQFCFKTSQFPVKIYWTKVIYHRKIKPQLYQELVPKGKIVLVNTCLGLK